MKREIKFRSYSDASGLITEWDILKHLHAATFINVNSDMFHLMQYTGLKDKNGKEIYEGDVLRLSGQGSIKVGEVKFVDAMFAVGNSYYLQSTLDAYEAEIIGNIYENPELLTK